MDDIEYLLEWPPPLSPAHTNSSAAKKRKLSNDHGSDEDSCSNEGRIDIELIENTSSAISTQSILAQWWKRNGGLVKQNVDFRLPQSKNPNTIIQYITNHPLAKKFLKARIDNLHSRPQTAQVLTRLSESYHMLQDEDNALHYITLACKRNSEKKEIKWLLAIIKRQHEIMKKQVKLSELVTAASFNNGKLRVNTLPQPIQVERRDCTSFSCESFMRDYALTQTPVIITGLQLTKNTWNLEYLAQTIGDKIAPLRQPIANSVEWARLESGGECRIHEFISDIKNQMNTNKYLFDWSLPLNCPQLFQELVIPEYFAGNLLRDTPPGTLYRDSWPSLFVSPPNITSHLHVDTFGSNFWMALFEGRKRWLFFPPEDLPCLYPLYTNSLDAVFQVDLKELDLTQYPLLSLTHPQECVLQPGEVLFVPAGSPHQVDSLNASVAISSNYIDISNINQSMTELELQSLTDSRAGELLNILKKKENIKEQD